MAPLFSLPGPALPFTTKSSNQSCQGFTSAAENVILRFGISSVVGCFVRIPEAPSMTSTRVCLIVNASTVATRLHAASRPVRRKRKLDASHRFCFRVTAAVSFAPSPAAWVICSGASVTVK